ncbi:ABC transporter ATP-binding protein [Sinanaerobacter sp. ZZT-01]|uniref:ABC transporter ATP-binding protein n=1 Tax=Sinanaerobacter sp. ZZT-01 TaxID=3111540 RepID=UPI002D78FFBA|nr:ABC transporter ATP-binding protein [Sinanaerobacter sp. ZZT-01]WRR94703.1 ABC transporter ATP-binding protein [Sinanaerobacter sp. ZZT-01]
MVLEVKSLEFAYEKQTKIFSDVNFKVEKGNVMTILGPNGAGKSTLLNCITSLLKPTKGTILLKNTPMYEMELSQAAKIIAYVPQVHIPTYEYTAREFIVMGRAPHLGLFQKPSKRDYEIADYALVQLDAIGLADKCYTKLSGGERQLVTIARAIAQEPELIILDEPTAHLDYGNQVRAIRLIKKLAKQGYGIIMTTHTPDHAILAGGQVGVLDYDGHLTVGTTEDAINENLLRHIYRTDVRIIYIEELGRNVCVSGI